jgi:hypothetical protein
MNEKLIGVIAILVLVSLGIFVSASMIIDNELIKDMRADPDSYIVSIELIKGWNIIAGTLPEEGIFPDSEIQSSDIKAMWYYSPIQKKYYQIHPEVDMSITDDDDYVLTTAMWIYSEKKGTLKYSTLEDYPSLENRQLYAGYNFFTITPNMTIDINSVGPEEEEKYTLNYLNGTCNIQSAYGWDNHEISGGGNWDKIEMDFPFSLNLQGVGILIKVSSDCTLGTSTGGTTPPGLPN